MYYATLSNISDIPFIIDAAGYGNIGYKELRKRVQN